jgi:hypothetical protein
MNHGEIARAAAAGLVELVSGLTGLSKAKSRELAMQGLQELRDNPPREIDVDAEKLDAAFERGRIVAEEPSES